LENSGNDAPHDQNRSHESHMSQDARSIPHSLVFFGGGKEFHYFQSATPGNKQLFFYEPYSTTSHNIS